MHFSDAQFVSLALALAPFLVSLAIYTGKLLIARLPANKRLEVLKIVHMSVYAAEQLGQGTSGASKKRLALDLINGSLKALGLSISPVFVEAAVEALVHEMNQQRVSEPTPK